MFFQNKKFKVVIIDYPINMLDDSFCSTILGKSLKMKFVGYNATYGENVLPMDKSDFFGTHIIFCEEVDQEFIPIFAYKSAPYDRCLEHGFEFPGLSLMKADGHPSCVKDLQKLLGEIKDPSKVSFDSSWAQNLDYRFSNNSELKNTLREIMMMVIVKHHEEFNIPHMVTCGVVKVKTDQFFLKIGLNKLNDQSHFIQKNLHDEEAVIFYNNSFSEIATEMAKKHKNLWEDKLVIDGRSTKKGQVRRAA